VAISSVRQLVLTEEPGGGGGAGGGSSGGAAPWAYPDRRVWGRPKCRLSASVAVGHRRRRGPSTGRTESQFSLLRAWARAEGSALCPGFGRSVLTAKSEQRAGSPPLSPGGHQLNTLAGEGASGVRCLPRVRARALRVASQSLEAANLETSAHAWRGEPATLACCLGCQHSRKKRCCGAHTIRRSCGDPAPMRARCAGRRSSRRRFATLVGGASSPCVMSPVRHGPVARRR